MSTPIPPNSKVEEGPDLYAPRRARGQSAAGDQEHPAATDQDAPTPSDQNQGASASDSEPQTLESSAAPEHDQPQAADDGATWGDDEAPDIVQARIDDAVKAVFDMEREFREERAGRSVHQGPVAPLPRAANLTASRSHAIWTSSASELQRRGHRLDRGAWLNAQLDPDIVPEPPPEMQRRMLPLLIRLSLVVGAAAIGAYGLTMISSQPDDAAHRQSGDVVASTGPMTQPTAQVVTHDAADEPQVAARLVVENQHAFVNEPIPLAASVAPSSGEESLVVAGLAAGTRLTAGTPVNESSWRVRSHDLHGLYLYAPKDFVGVMNTAVDLLSPTQRLLDSRAVRLEWIPKKPLPAQRNAESTTGGSNVAALQPSDKGDAASASLPAVQPLDPEQVALLMKRGREALSTGDIAAARLAFRRLADAGNADGALGLAATYDPRYLAGQSVIGVTGDEAQARVWYQRAMELGSVEAKNILARMATK